MTSRGAGAGRRQEDRGVATVWGLALGVVLVSSGAVIGGIASVSVGHQRAAVAADLSAVAAATHGCAAAERVAAAQGAISVACHVEGADAIVTVAMPAPGLLERLARWSGREAPALASTSRAGPASDAGPGSSFE